MAIGERVSKLERTAQRTAMTLMELLIVLGIIAVVVGMSVPAMTRYSSQARLKATVRQMAGFLSLARSLSIGSQSGHTVLVDIEHRRMTVMDNTSGEVLEQQLRLPQGIDVTLESGGEVLSPAEIVFQPSGSLRGRTVSVIIKEGQKRATIAISGITGAVTAE